MAISNIDRARVRVRGDVAHPVTGLALLLALALGACGPREVPLGQLEPDVLWSRAQAEYAEEDWDEAVRLFQGFVFNHPTHPRIQEARYMLALSYFEDEQYVTAAQEFSRLSDDYPQGEYGDDARFKTCEAYYLLSPKVQLDQEYTRAAMEHCQSLLAYYPQSEFAPRAREIIDAMTTKLARKIYEEGEYYFKRRAYDSAILSYEIAIERYPNTPVAPAALLRIVDAYEAIGYEDEAEEARQRLLRAYPNSEQAAIVRGGGLPQDTAAHGLRPQARSGPLAPR